MRRATHHAAAGTWPQSAAIDAVSLDYEARHRRRIRLVTEGGEAVLLDLAKAVAMADGDGLRCADGYWIAVRAADEPLLEVICETGLDLLRAAWHLGNRHFPSQLLADRIRIRNDHVIAEMLRNLGAELRAVRAPFQPEGGAYARNVAAHDHHRHDHEHH
jgi:urease accessory protein